MCVECLSSNETHGGRKAYIHLCACLVSSLIDVIIPKITQMCVGIRARATVSLQMCVYISQQLCVWAEAIDLELQNYPYFFQNCLRLPSGLWHMFKSQRKHTSDVWRMMEGRAALPRYSTPPCLLISVTKNGEKCECKGRDGFFKEERRNENVIMST